MNNMNKLLIGLGAVVVLSVGSVALASQAVPGDLLYGLKLGVNERVEARFAGEGRARVDWQIKIAERRLSEAAKAAEKEQFNTDRQAAVLLSFNEQMKGVEEYMVAAQDDGRIDEVKELAVKVGQMLARQTEVLIAAQTQAHLSTDPETQVALDFLVLRATDSLTAAAFIAASTLIEDEAPVPEIDPSTVDEFGRPI